ncbi:hypothetical protein PFBG_04114 [Plasmodium falciparum 7G8]|uniref:Uncharacterized protein n=1 Tax=Plasmodium falciparum (isolate 7G8) TaxID=57266 RepID=W7FIT3_PLAF8|nr:hypothetical protein PFBG_04114 [Plasmodium falciparum 7G8]
MNSFIYIFLLYDLHITILNLNSSINTNYVTANNKTNHRITINSTNNSIITNNSSINNNNNNNSNYKNNTNNKILFYFNFPVVYIFKLNNINDYSHYT